MSLGNHSRSQLAAIEQKAAEWLARRDRGLAPGEQDDYLQWLQEDPRHAVAIAQHDAALKRMMQLREWQPAQSSEPNPDLFAPPSRRFRLLSLTLAAAAVIAVGFFAWSRFAPPRAGENSPRSHLVVNERQALPDGSLVELRDGSSISLQFTEAERRVRLTGWEAHFAVAKNPARPFIVETGGVAVRAVGTAFDVRLEAGSVEVLVTEGKVHLEQRVPAENVSPPAAVVAGQRAVVSRDTVAPTPKITTLTPAEVREALEWQKPRLQFYETPLADAVAEFNRHNRRQISLAEPGLGTVPIGGTFRVDNVDGFTRLLEVTLHLHAESRGTDEVVLTRTR